MQTTDKLVGVSFAKAETVQIHEMKMDGDKMMMRDIGSFTDPRPWQGRAQGQEDTILMFLGLKEPLKDGESTTIVLQFEKAGKVEVKMPIKAMMNHSNHSNMHSVHTD
jgi:copper(I)-binding protein